MALSAVRSWIVAYDITEPRRLRQVHAFLTRHAHAVQYSVFLAVCTERQLERLLASVDGQISPRLDDVRAYPLPEWARPFCIGVAHPLEWVLAGEDLPAPARGLLSPEPERNRNGRGFLIEEG
jgi:CRISPR-associated protein Cas2